MPVTTKVILSSHNFTSTPDAASLKAQAKKMHEAGADIVKIATMANDISDAANMLGLLLDPVGGCKGEQDGGWGCEPGAGVGRGAGTWTGDWREG